MAKIPLNDHDNMHMNILYTIFTKLSNTGYSRFGD